MAQQTGHTINWETMGVTFAALNGNLVAVFPPCGSWLNLQCLVPPKAYGIEIPSVQRYHDVEHSCAPVLLRHLHVSYGQHSKICNLLLHKACEIEELWCTQSRF